jgi:hypothetical protein
MAETQQQETRDREKKPKAWRAKEACTYDGRYFRQGGIVYADKMDNPHFEIAESKTS